MENNSSNLLSVPKTSLMPSKPWRTFRRNLSSVPKSRHPPNEPLLHTQKKLPLLKMICTPFLVVQKGGYISQIAAAFSAEKSYII